MSPDRRPLIGARPAAALFALLALLAIGGSRAQSAQRVPAEPAAAFYEPSFATRGTVKLAPAPRAKIRLAAREVGQQQPPAVGDRRLWPALDRKQNTAYLKFFTLRGAGSRIEVWVASDQDAVSTGLEFPPGDCRNDERVQLSDAQVQYLVQQFDQNIYPKESEAFSVPPPRDGSNAQLPPQAGLPPDYYRGDGGRVVALVDNIRDPQFYDVNVRVGIGGVFVPFFNEQLDRNVITIDGVDWIHRTGPSPPHEPVPSDLCRSRAGHPFLIEGTFAHEYQHLLEYYQDRDEVSWINEGLSMLSESVTGYLDSRKPVTAVGFSSTAQCFLGYIVVQTDANPNPLPGGPENSLTGWGDKGDQQILCDYGAAETFMEYLLSHYGLGLISQLHRDPDNGLVSLRKLLGGVSNRDAAEIVHDWAAAIALDGVVDRGWRLSGGPASRYQVPSFDGSVNWKNPDAYLTPGAPPNGSDYVRLRDRAGKFLKASQIRSLSFDGGETLPPRPVEWVVDRNPLDHAGDPAFYSGSGGGLDRAIVRQVTVPANAPTLAFDTRFDLAPGRDFAFVQVSTDGGKTWRSLASELTTSTVDPNASSTVRRNLPGLTGKSGKGQVPLWISASFDLSTYRGKTVLLAFRYVSDPALAFPGWWIDNVRLGGARIGDGTSLAAWRSATQVNPVRVNEFTVQLVGYTAGEAKRAFLQRLKLDRSFHGELADRDLRQLRAGAYDVVAAIVTYDEPAEQAAVYAPYALRVNGFVQPGGAPVR